MGLLKAAAFSPEVLRTLFELKPLQPPTLLMHYTNPAAALAMLRGRELWASSVAGASYQRNGERAFALGLAQAFLERVSADLRLSAADREELHGEWATFLNTWETYAFCVTNLVDSPLHFERFGPVALGFTPGHLKHLLSSRGEEMANAGVNAGLSPMWYGDVLSNKRFYGLLRSYFEFFGSSTNRGAKLAACWLGLQLLGTLLLRAKQRDPEWRGEEEWRLALMLPKARVHDSWRVGGRGSDEHRGLRLMWLNEYAEYETVVQGCIAQLIQVVFQQERQSKAAFAFPLWEAEKPPSLEPLPVTSISYRAGAVDAAFRQQLVDALRDGRFVRTPEIHAID